MYYAKCNEKEKVKKFIPYMQEYVKKMFQGACSMI